MGGRFTRLLDSHGPIVAMALGALAVSFAAIFIRKAAPTHPLMIASLRLGIAALCLSPFVIRALLRGRLPTPTVKAALLGGVAYAFHFATWVWSLSLTSVAASVTLVTVTPILLGIYGAATKNDAPSRTHWIAVGIALVGVTIIGVADQGTGSALLGDGLAFFGAASVAVYMVIVRRRGAELDILAFSGISTFTGAVLLAGLAFGLGVDFSIASQESFLFILLAALVPQLIGHTLLMWALRRTKPVVVGLATVAEPVGSTLLGWLWLAEVPPQLTLVGCGFTLVAVLVALLGKKQLGKTEPRT